MKLFTIIASICSIVFLFGQCKQSTTLSNDATTIDSLQQIINDLKPGLGEYMMQLEYHHDKLKAAAKNNNIERVSYETDEVEEVLEKIKLFHNKHEKLQAKTFTEWSNVYIEPSLKLIKEAVITGNQTTTITAAQMLTINCNNCHEVNKVAFIKVDY